MKNKGNRTIPKPNVVKNWNYSPHEITTESERTWQNSRNTGTGCGGS